MISLLWTVARVVRRLSRPVRNWWARHEVAEQLEGLAALGSHVAVNGPITIGNPNATRFGDDVCINPGFHARGSGSLTIGSHVHIGIDVHVLTSNHRFRGATSLPYDHVRDNGPVSIGDCVWIGDRVTIVPGVTLGEGAIVGAGSVVTRDVDPLAIVGGAPARVIGQRNEVEYRALKGAGQFIGVPRATDLVNKRPFPLRRRRNA